MVQPGSQTGSVPTPHCGSLAQFTVLAWCSKHTRSSTMCMFATRWFCIVLRTTRPHLCGFRIQTGVLVSCLTASSCCCQLLQKIVIRHTPAHMLHRLMSGRVLQVRLCCVTMHLVIQVLAHEQQFLNGGTSHIFLELFVVVVR
jgi:hypothetical protein